jgi:hypothetical protein
MRRRTIFAGLALGLVTMLVTGASGCSEVGAKGSKGPNYSLARSAACLRADGYRDRVSVRRYRDGSGEIEIKARHHWGWATFAPDRATARRWAEHPYSDSDFFPPDRARNVLFYSATDKRILACLRTSRD